MKRNIRLCTVLLALCLFSSLFVGCGSKNPYLGVWYCYKISTPSNEIVFSDYKSIVKMELTAEFTSDGQYELHYYVNGKEGDKYPQVGKYEIDGDKITLIDADGYGKIVNNELILYFDNGEVEQHYSSIAPTTK